jgi:hypothetical protein
MLHDFFGRTGKTPDEITSQDVFAWANGTGLSGKTPGSVTIGARLACLSSFYKFLIRMKVVAANPGVRIPEGPPPNSILESRKSLQGGARFFLTDTLRPACTKPAALPRFSPNTGGREAALA